MASSANNMALLGKKTIVTLNAVKRMIVGEVIKAEYSKKDGKKGYEPLVLYFEGTMGVGKSQSVQQAKDDLSEILGTEFGLIDIRLAGMTGSDIQGIPVPYKEDGETYLKWLKDSLLPGISKNCPKHGILFLDELNQVEDNSVKSLLYQLILDKKINDYVVPEGWYIVAAGNREEDGGVYNRLPAPVRDRMMIVEVEVNKDEWLNNFARPYKVHPAVIAFIENNDAKYLHSYDPEKESDGDEECENYVFATPRSWVMVSDQVYAYEDRSLNLEIPIRGYGRITQESDLTNKVCALLGVGIGDAFMTFYNQIAGCNVEEIYAISWKGGRPSKEVRLEKEHLAYLTELATYPSDANFDKSMKILFFLLHNGDSATGVRYILDSYTEAQNKRLNDACIDNQASNLITQLSSYSDKFKAIEKLQKN